jgi:predicted O-methyltransferase YrrM
MRHAFKQATQALRGIPKRAANPYTTHLPVLIGLSHVLPVKRVLEFGCGEYSTLTFLDRAVFPDLVELHSFDNDPVWIEKIAALTQNDARLTLNGIEGPIYSTVTDTPFHRYDLVFIDDSISITDRTTTIDAVSRHCTPANVIIIHDFEVPDYRRAAKLIKNQFAVTALNPQTGILWNTSNIEHTKLRTLNKIVQRYARSIPLDNRDAWTQIMKQRCTD